MSGVKPGGARWSSDERQRWGWHRLTDEWSARIVEAAGVRPQERIIEVGAGTGSLTAALVDAGAQVIAVELHPGRAARLRARFDSAAVAVVEVDVRDFRWPRQQFRVLANPPFGVSAALLRILLDPRNSLRRADLVLQRSVVDRQVRSANRGFVTGVGLQLPRSAFVPRPRVDAAVLTVRRRTRSPRHR